jgi:hypothetical protein
LAPIDTAGAADRSNPDYPFGSIVCHGPQVARRFERFKAVSRPPISFLAGAVQFAMMRAAKGHGELVVDLLCQAARLRKAKMMRI